MIRYLLRIHDVNLKRCIIELIRSINFDDSKNEWIRTSAT